MSINDEIITLLARQYISEKSSRVVVANICDGIIDQSGRLLGEVRKRADTLEVLEKSHYCLECGRRWFGPDLRCDDPECPFKVKSCTP